MNYTYDTNSNKILKVDDASGETASFSDVAGNDYTYNLDGSLASDANKGITIEYNYLKLPRRIVKGSTVILNEYDANGKKLKETVGSNITDYSSNKIYKNGALYQIGHDEGRIIDGQYEYFINDHLGNLRVAFRDSSGIAKISQKQDYDPYGSELQKLSYLKSSWKQSDFKFSGKEFIEQTGLNDFGWRPQDPILGRMWGSDRFAEKYYDLSNFQYAGNNPIMNIDVNGDSLMLFKNGTYVSTIDNGKKEITGFDQQSTIGKDGKESFTGGKSFSFNDYADDMEGIKSGELKLRFVNNNEIRSTLIETGVTDETSRNSPWSYIERESRPIGDKSLLSCTSTGCMDYQNITNKKFNSLNVVKGVAYNNADYGNFLWGQAGKQLGFSLNSLTTAAHLNNAVNSRRNNPDQPYGFFDSDGDQRAIKQGYKYNVGKINILKR